MICNKVIYNTQLSHLQLAPSSKAVNTAQTIATLLRKTTSAAL